MSSTYDVQAISRLVKSYLAFSQRVEKDFKNW